MKKIFTILSVLVLSGVIYAQGVFNDPKFIDYTRKNYQQILLCADLTFDECGKKGEEAAKSGDAQRLQPFIDFIQKATTNLGLPSPSTEEMTFLFKEQQSSGAYRPKKSNKRRNVWDEMEKIRRPVWDELNEDRGEMEEQQLVQLKLIIGKGIGLLEDFGKTVKPKTRIGKEVFKTVKQWKRELKRIDEEIAEIASEDYREKLEDIREEINEAHRIDAYDESSVVVKRNKFIELKNKLMAFEREVAQYKQLVREIKQQIGDIDEHALKYLNNDLERYQQEKSEELSASLIRNLLLGQIANNNKPCR